MLRSYTNSNISSGFNFNNEYKESLYIAIDKLIVEIDNLIDEERYFESNLTRNTLSKLVNDYRLCVGEYILTQRFPSIYSYIY